MDGKVAVRINIIMSIIRKSLDQKRLVSIITILTKREEWSKIKLSKSKIIAITINQMEREVQQKNIQKQIGTKYYYFNSKSQVSFYKGFVTIDNKKYFFDSSGKSVSGWVICPVGLAGWFVDEINGLYAAHTYTPFDNLCKNADIRKDLKKVTVPKAVKLDYGQEYGLNKLSEQGVTVVYIE